MIPKKRKKKAEASDFSTKALVLYFESKGGGGGESAEPEGLWYVNLHKDDWNKIHEIIYCLASEESPVKKRTLL